MTDGITNPVKDMQRMFDVSPQKVAHLVQMTGKIRTGHLVPEIKRHCWIVAMRRRDKIQQFASWTYFHKSGGVLRQWHNHKSENMIMRQNSVVATQEEIDHFIMEQMLDDFFQPDDVVYYEDLNLEHSKIKKNLYAWNLSLIFSNLEFVQKNLEHWRYNE